jgi:Biotin carboxylase
LKPTILLASTNFWLSPVRIAQTFADLGCTVQVVCPDRNALTVSSAVHRTHRYRSFQPLPSISAAIKAAKPDLVVPCDDFAAAHLHTIERRSRHAPATFSTTVELLSRSLGSPASYPIVDSRHEFLATARAEGVLVPNSALIPGPSALDNWTRESGFPAVLKRDCTSGGEGVRIVKTRQQAQRAFRELLSRRPTSQTLKRILLDRDNTFLARLLRREPPLISVQQFVFGQDANVAVACWQGEVLAQIGATVLKARSPMGPAAVIGLVEDSQMSAAVKKIVQRLGLSGFAGFDFVIEHCTGNPFLIEINPRATQTCHLQLGMRGDLAAALCAAVSGSPMPNRASVTASDAIVLWPHVSQDLLPANLMQSVYFDTPNNDPEVVRLYGSAKRSTLSTAMKSLWKTARI